MEKEFIPYEQALDLKELGFNEKCFGFYDLSYKFRLAFTSDQNFYEQQKCSAPTFSQAFRFFREKEYQAEILWRSDFSDFCWKIGRFKYGSHLFSKDGFNTYEEAELECLKKLIEIAKEQNVK